MSRDVSVIVPVYNARVYLSQCIESIIAISTKKASIEIILVDDGSTDGSGEMCDGYALRDRRIRVLHQENRGVSAARNAGVDASAGDYFMFIDSDDYVHADIVDSLLCSLDSYGGDIAMCGFTHVDERGKTLHAFSPTERVISGERALAEMSRGVFFTVWAALYKRKVWKNARFPEGMTYGEDAYAKALVLAQTKTIVIDSQPLYYYRVHSGNSVGVLNHQKFVDIIFFYREYLKIISKIFRGDELQRIHNEYMYRLLIVSLMWRQGGCFLSAEELRLLSSLSFGAKIGCLRNFSVRAHAACIILRLPLALHTIIMSLLSFVVDLRRLFLKTL